MKSLCLQFSIGSAFYFIFNMKSEDRMDLVSFFMRLSLTVSSKFLFSHGHGCEILRRLLFVSYIVTGCSMCCCSPEAFLWWHHDFTASDRHTSWMTKHSYLQSIHQTSTYLHYPSHQYLILFYSIQVLNSNPAFSKSDANQEGPKVAGSQMATRVISHRLPC